MWLARRAGFGVEDIVLTADLWDADDRAALAEHGLEVSLGSRDMIAPTAEAAPGTRVRLRVNPGWGDGHHQRVNTGGPHSKHGIWHAELKAVAREAMQAGLRVVGIHVHIGSGARPEALARLRSSIGAALEAVANDDLELFSVGGGLPTPYRQGEEPFDARGYTSAWLSTRDDLQEQLGRPLKIETEPGRYLVAQCGVLLTRVCGTKSQGDVDYTLVDAGFHNLLRPALYGAHHRITALDPKGTPRPTMVAGPLCESGDVFTQDAGGVPAPQDLPPVEVGDLMVIHDVGAYGNVMASRYNARRPAPEILIDGDDARLIRRRPSYADLFDDLCEESA